MRRILFVRIGWMKFYAGSQPSDKRPIGGGEYNVDSIGGEVNQFKNRNGHVYGSFGFASTTNGLNFSRIDPQHDKGNLGNVLIVFFATDPRPASPGQVVVGWYKGATLRRWHIKKPYEHVASTKTANATLLPTSRRRWIIPRGKNATGQSNTFFVLEKDGSPKRLTWLAPLLENIDNYSGPDLLRNPGAEADPEMETARENAVVGSSGQGIGLDVDGRLLVEERAMKAATTCFKKKGYKVLDVSSSRSYDLHCQKAEKTIMVEVKGTQSALKSIFLTPNEVKLAKSGKPMALFVQHSITVTRTRKGVRASGGKSFVIDPWKIKKKNLKPIAWEYTLR